MIFANEIDILKSLAEKKLISDAAVTFSEFLCSLEQNLQGRDLQILAAIAALVPEWAASGSICLTKKDIEKFAEENKEAAFPDWTKISEILSASSCCTQDPEHDVKPLVLSDDRIYFYKNWLSEDSLAGKVLKLSQGEGKYSERAGEIETVFEQLFDETSQEQHSAAETVINHRFSVITGGPGTGKTTTVAKILAGILSVYPEEKIVLAAPTGKAAARMTEALKDSVEDKKGRNNFKVISQDIRNKILSLESRTIHSVLGKKFGKTDKNRENPINADLIIVDEASMIDIVMFSELADAVSEETSLVLLGDKDQLASVDVGNVFSDICSAAEKELFGYRFVAKLTISYRFINNPGIGKLAKAVNEKKTADEIVKICKEESNLEFSEIKSEKEIKDIVSAAAEKYKFLSDTNLSPAAILGKLNDFKILCPSKEDSLGVEQLNKEIEKELGKDGSDAYYNGRPVMITKNDRDNTRLVNGDCGVILKRNGVTKAWFKQNGVVRSFNISELPAFETVYAMTIHKSQGSEYESVFVVLPENDMQILTKELLYTAITRAKTCLTTFSGKEILKKTLERSAARNSGFENALKKLNQTHE